jgi:hypothetical protein
VRQEDDRISEQLGSRPIEALAELPLMIDPSCRAIMDVLTAIQEPSHFVDGNLPCLITARMVNLSLKHGNSDGSPVAYVRLGWSRQGLDFNRENGRALRASRTGHTRSGMFEPYEFVFYDALARAAQYNVASSGERAQHHQRLVAHQKQIRLWAENCAENFENRAALVSAEIARIEGRELEAWRLYEQAIRSARENGFIQNEGIANELAARFYMALGLEKIAHVYLQDARSCYLRWEAAGKVRQLEELYPLLREEAPVRGPASTIGAPVEHLDLATVIKASQAISGEIVLEKLINTLMRIALEQAGG